MIRVASVALVLSAPAVAAQDYPALHAVSGVEAADVLNIRALPDAEADIVGTLAPDATGIEVVDVVGKWAVVNTPEASGYAALRFLDREPRPAWNALQEPLHCLGTEPFWDLAIAPATKTAWLSTPDAADPEALAMGPIWPATMASAVAAFAVPDGFVALAPADCSDGMSDRRYGIAVDIFLNRSESPRLSGCCSLNLP